MSGEPRTESHLASVAPTDTVLTCSVALGEVLYGIERLPSGGRRRVELEQNVTRALTIVHVVPVPIAAARLYAVAKVQCQRGGIALNENDLWIAASALALDATVVTHDNDFGRVHGLPTQNWRT